MENWLIAIATVVIAGATIAQAVFSSRLYQLQVELEKERKRVEPFIVFDWASTGPIAVKIINPHSFPLTFEEIALLFSRPNQATTGRARQRGHWFLAPLDDHGFVFDLQDVRAAVDNAGLSEEGELEVQAEITYYAHGERRKERMSLFRGRVRTNNEAAFPAPDGSE